MVLAHLRSLVLPLFASVFVPWLLVGLGDEPPRTTWWHALRAAPVLAMGLAMLGWTVALFVRVGKGTLAPWNPTRRLVVVGPYAHVRNPMISGVFCILCGEALLLESSRMATWALLFLVVNHVYFVFSEEPGLTMRFGAEYTEYALHVPRWLPRLRPWRPDRTL
ncbi:isoprenylcysteine carboxyl methyltransferase [Pendulispora rubella]|uniref:Isoprenylcysteine carboxyl methyltransferase n=1 Tax=Pendulispora rubella TaxID=2741070 RepID=A0ABZ2KPA3_9BACT